MDAKNGNYDETIRYSSDRDFAHAMDQKDPLKHLRKEFRMPTKRSLNSNSLVQSESDDPGIYFCGSQIGLQTARTPHLIQKYLNTWATQGMYGLAKKMESSSLPNWGEADRVAASMMTSIVGALENEVAVMGNLTMNLHVLMASFYRPFGNRTQVILERDAFSSDFYAIDSQIRWHGLDAKKNMVLVEPENEKTMAISTSHILDLIETHASSAALIILSGVQYLSGQLLDMKKITSCARSKGMVVGWDLAHAVGNVELRLHEWDVDFAVWCNYKYMNSGPGAIGSSFVHQRHGGVDGNEGYRPRLAGWWGNDMKNRFQMQNCMYSHTLKSILLLISDFAFSPSVGAAGYQISNPSILDIVALIASLEVFNLTDMSSIRHKSVLLTGYLQYLLQEMCPSPFQIMTSSRASERGAQLSLRFEDVHTLDNVMDKLRKLGIVVAQKQDVMRIAPVPMYNTFTEVWEFVDELHRAVSSVGE